MTEEDNTEHFARFNIREEDDQRVGVRRFYFDIDHRPWSLMTSEGRKALSSYGSDERPYSYLHPKEDGWDGVWHRHHIMTIDGIITPEAAIQIIQRVYTVHGHGIKVGHVERANLIKRALEV